MSSNTEMIEIVSITPPQMIKGSRGTFPKVTVTDGITGKTASAIGDWVLGWRIGDRIEVIVENDPKYGFQLKNPSFTPRSSTVTDQRSASTPERSQSSSASIDVHAFMIASTLAPELFKAQNREFTLDNVAKLALAIKDRLIGNAIQKPVQQMQMTPPPVAPVVAQPVAQPTTTYKVVDTEDDKPF